MLISSKSSKALSLDMGEKIYLDCLSNISPLGIDTESDRLWEISQKTRISSSRPLWEMAADRSGERSGAIHITDGACDWGGAAASKMPFYIVSENEFVS